MRDDRSVIDLTVQELTELFETKAHNVATSFATTKIQEAVRVGCLDCFKDFGFDTESPKECIKNQMYLTRARVSSDKVTMAVKVSLATAIVTVTVGGLVKLFQIAFSSPAP